MLVALGRGDPRCLLALVVSPLIYKALFKHYRVDGKDFWVEAVVRVGSRGNIAVW